MLTVRLRNPDREVELHACETCGQPTTERSCAFCRAWILGRRLGPPVTDRDVTQALSEDVFPAEISRRASA